MPRPGKISDPPKIDRNKYKSQIDKGEFVYSADPGGFEKDILERNNHKIVGGSERNGDLVTRSGDNYFLYSKQPGYAAGLVNIGKINPYSQSSPVTQTPSTTQAVIPQQVAQPKPVVDPNRQPLNFNNPGYYSDPNTGKNYSYEDNKEIPTISNSYKKGGVVKKFGPGGPIEDSTDASVNTALSGGIAGGIGIAGQALANNVGNDPTKFQKTKNNDVLLGAVGPTAANALLPGSGALVAPALALKSQLQNQAEEIDPETGEFKNQKNANAYGLANGLLNASPLGAIGTVLDKDKSLKEKALAVGTGGISNAFTWKKDQQGTEDKNIALATDIRNEKQRKRNEQDMISSTGTVFAERGFNDGGVIKGKGTGKSDSIKAKIRPGSFIVPVENAAQAKAIKEKVLADDPDEKATVKQKGGVPGLSVSNGEVLFSPEEVKELTAAGINLDALAPDAKQKLRDTHQFNCGGTMKYRDGGKTPPKKKVYIHPDPITDEGERAYMSKKYGNAYTADEGELAYLRARGKNSEAKKTIPTTSKASATSQRNGIAGPVEQMLPQGSETVLPPATTEPTLKTSTPSAAETSFVNSQGYKDNALTGDPLATGPSTRATGLLSKLNLDQIANYALPALQIGLGNKMLNQAGKRPVFDYDPAFLNNINVAQNAVTAAKRNAQYGFTPEEKFQMQQDNQALTNSQRFAARNASGGSAANAIVNDTAAINSSYGRGLASRIADNQLKLQKQGIVDARQQAYDDKISEKQGISRMLFGDTMNAWQQQQAAGGNLLGSGISNGIGAQRLNNELAYKRDRDARYGVNYNVPVTND